MTAGTASAEEAAVATGRARRVTAQTASAEELLERAAAGDRRAAGKLLTRVERGGADAERIAEAACARAGGAHVIGVTGPPGAGKSTLVAELAAALASGGARPAVLAVDPSSALTGGAILGDRVRMAAVDSTAFVRSMATRGHTGGLALAVPGAVRVLDAAGYNPVMIETVGAGQLEVDISAAADTTVVVTAPGLGDAVQANKAGLFEVADIFVVNKSDLGGADHARRDLELMADLSRLTGHGDPRWPPRVLTASAADGTGVDEAGAAIDDHRRHLASSGAGVERRRRRARFEIAGKLRRRFDRSVSEYLDSPPAGPVLSAVAAGELSPAAAARRAAAEILAAAGRSEPAAHPRRFEQGP